MNTLLTLALLAHPALAVPQRGGALSTTAPDEVVTGSPTPNLRSGYATVPLSPMPSVVLAKPQATATTVSIVVDGVLAWNTVFRNDATVVVPAGATSASLPLYLGRPVEADAWAMIVASSPLGAAKKAILLRPNPLASVSGPVSVKGGTAASGTVALGLYALTAEDVTLACSDPAVKLPANATVPGPVYVSLGPFGGGSLRLSNSQTFAITTPVVAAPRTVRISASRAGVTKSLDLTIVP